MVSISQLGKEKEYTKEFARQPLAQSALRGAGEFYS